MGLGDFLFKEKEEKYLKQIEDLQNKLKKKEEEILQLKYDIEVVTQERDNRISGKQLEIFERNLKQNMESSKKYKELLVSYRINSEKTQYKYKVELKNFYSEKKFQEVFDILNEKNILFVNNLKEEDFNDIPKETKNLDDAKQYKEAVLLRYVLGGNNFEEVTGYQEEDGIDFKIGIANILDTPHMDTL